MVGGLLERAKQPPVSLNRKEPSNKEGGHLRLGATGLPLPSPPHPGEGPRVRPPQSRGRKWVSVRTAGISPDRRDLCAPRAAAHWARPQPTTLLSEPGSQVGEGEGLSFPLSHWKVTVKRFYKQTQNTHNNKAVLKTHCLFWGLVSRRVSPPVPRMGAVAWGERGLTRDQHRPARPGREAV